MRWNKKGNIPRSLWNILYKKLDIRRITYEGNDVEAIEYSDGILWLNKTHTEEGLDHKNLQVNTVKYPPGYGKHRFETIDEPKKQPNIIFTPKELATKSNYGLWNNSST